MKAVTALFRHLKSAYKDSDIPFKYLVMVTVVGTGITNGLNTGAYLLSDPNEKLLETLKSMIINFLKSRQDVQIDDSFGVRIKIISVAHLKALVEKGKIKMSQYLHRPKVRKINQTFFCGKSIIFLWQINLIIYCLNCPARLL